MPLSAASFLDGPRRGDLVGLLPGQLDVLELAILIVATCFVVIPARLVNRTFSRAPPQHHHQHGQDSYYVVRYYQWCVEVCRGLWG